MATATTIIADERQRIVKNSLLNGVRWITTLASSFIVSVLVARALGPRDTGVYSYVLWLATVGSSILSLGLPDTLAKYIPEYLGCGNVPAAANLARRLLLIQTIVAAGGALIALVVLRLTPSGYSEGGVIVLAVAVLIPQTMQQALTSVLLGLQRFDRLAVTSVITALSSLICIGSAFALHAGIRGMVLASAVASICTCIAAYRCSTSLLQARVDPAAAEEIDWKRIRKFLFACGYILFLDLVVWQRSEIFFLKLYSTLPQLAFYSIAFGLTQRAHSIPGAFTGTLMTMFSGRFGRAGLSGINSVYPTAVKFTQIVMLPVCSLGLVVAKPLVQLIYGSTYAPMVPVLMILLVTAAVIALGGVTASFVAASDRMAFSVKYGTLAMILNLGLDWLLIPRWGAVGAAVANSAAQMSAIVASLIYIRHVTGPRFPWESTFKTYASAAIAAIPSILVSLSEQGSPVAIFATAAAGVPIYIAALMAFHELSIEDIRTIRGSLRAGEEME